MADELINIGSSPCRLLMLPIDEVVEVSTFRSSSYRSLGQAPSLPHKCIAVNLGVS